MTDSAVLEWPENPTGEDLEPFVFLLVDVVDSSSLFEEEMPEDLLLENAAAMNAVYDHVRSCLFDLEVGSAWEWNWAGDGGVFAFRANRLGMQTTETVFQCAQKIAELPPFRRANGEQMHLQLRIVIDRGQAYFHEINGLRRSAALNRASKLRVPGLRTSLTITEDVRKKLDRTDRDRSDLFRPILVGQHPPAMAWGFVPLMLRALEQEIEGATDKSQAAHLSYRLGRLNLSVGRREAAVHAFQRAIDCIKQLGDKPKHRYFWRTLLELYRMWRIIAAEGSDELLQESEGHDWLKMMQPGLRWDTFVSHHREAPWRLLPQLEVIMEQLDVLAGQPVNDPVGLTSLEVCLLLERMGYPRRWYGTAVADRIERIRADMRQSTYRQTIDDGCSMCTAVAVSCLLLEGDDKNAGILIEWLHDTANDRFCYRHFDSFADADGKEHAVHYAAAVLQAFLDDGTAKNHSFIEAVLDVFFEEEEFKIGDFPLSWTKWRNTTTYDFCSYIFPTFTRLLLLESDEVKLDDDQRIRRLTQTLQSLALQIDRDGFDARLRGNTRGRVYGARENIGSFALGLLIGLPKEVEPILKYNLGRFAAYANRRRSDAQRQRTIDSSIDRARKMIEGWLLQIECALHQHNQGNPLPAPVIESLGIGAPASAGDSA